MALIISQLLRLLIVCYVSGYNFKLIFRSRLKQTSIYSSSVDQPKPYSSKRFNNRIRNNDNDSNNSNNNSKEQKKIRNQGSPRDREINNPSRLKIIAGTAKGTKLLSPDVYLRPMMAKVREALFSTLDFLDVFVGNNTRVLDTFSGSGSVGLEALSRGASHTTFVDLASECTQVSLQNAQKCGFQNQVSAVCARTEDVLTNPSKFGLSEPYNLISITPPYEEVSYDVLINSVCNSPLVTEDTIGTFLDT